jgi:hypothetical protein
MFAHTSVSNNTPSQSAFTSFCLSCVFVYIGESATLPSQLESRSLITLIASFTPLMQGRARKLDSFQQCLYTELVKGA